MTRHPHPDFLALCDILNRHGVDYLVIGGWACILHGLPRTTQDVDLYIPGEEENCSKLIAGLSSIGFGIARELTPEMILTRKIFQFADQIRVDLFVQAWGIARFADAKARCRVFEVGGVRVPALSVEDLIASKQTDRPQDAEDCRALERLRGQA